MESNQDPTVIKLLRRLRSNILVGTEKHGTAARIFFDGWDQKAAFSLAADRKDYLTCLSLLLMQFASNPGMDITSLFNTDIQELAEACGHVGVLYDVTGKRMIARVMYEPDCFEPGNQPSGQCDKFDLTGSVTTSWFGGAVNPNAEELEYEVGQKFHNNSNDKELEILEINGIDDYGIGTVGEPKNIKTFGWMSEEELQQWVRRGVYSPITDDETEDEGLDGSIEDRGPEANATPADYVFLCNGWNVNVTKSTLLRNTKKKMYWDFTAYDGPNRTIEGTVITEENVHSGDWEIEDIDFNYEDEQLILNADGDMWETFATGMEL
jgi:hypothetical protein